MKAKELMIGDWVMQNGVVLQMLPHMMLQCNFSPIPLTAGMLENNDIYDIYEKDDIPLFRTYKLKTQYGFRSQNCHPCTISISANILYVHELQHLLRLCGLNDLADNFKVD